MRKQQLPQENIRLGTHGENYGSWMSNPVFFLVGGGGALSAALAVLSYLVFHNIVFTAFFSLITMLLFCLLIWITWIRWQYAFDGGRIMERVHQIVLSHLVKAHF